MPCDHSIMSETPNTHSRPLDPRAIETRIPHHLLARGPHEGPDRWHVFTCPRNTQGLERLPSETNPVNIPGPVETAFPQGEVSLIISLSRCFNIKRQLDSG